MNKIALAIALTFAFNAQAGEMSSACAAAKKRGEQVVEIQVFDTVGEELNSIEEAILAMDPESQPVKFTFDAVAGTATRGAEGVNGAVELATESAATAYAEAVAAGGCVADAAAELDLHGGANCVIYSGHKAVVYFANQGADGGLTVVATAVDLSGGALGTGGDLLKDAANHVAEHAGPAGEYIGHGVAFLGGTLDAGKAVLGLGGDLVQNGADSVMGTANGLACRPLEAKDSVEAAAKAAWDLDAKGALGHAKDATWGFGVNVAQDAGSGALDLLETLWNTASKGLPERFDETLSRKTN
jgi:hypothetical protein